MKLIIEMHKKNVKSFKKIQLIIKISIESNRIESGHSRIN
jgi:hypothetical protein